MSFVFLSFVFPSFFFYSAKALTNTQAQKKRRAHDDKQHQLAVFCRFVRELQTTEIRSKYTDTTTTAAALGIFINKLTSASISIGK